ncbi:hypothetical protein [Chitinophaga sp. S165]|uniref:hypothetical protein n=1 Tax=Chitinophaga sp. S165 TaxID=2135462 RepID=UPI000D90627A|nr:hypothetical protein [Chitinophaga sp. S165]PWV49128.1 hypothetical protein C7475_106374 [Chitinophaga sp. S165]
MQDLHNEIMQLRRQMNFFRMYAIVSSVLILAFIGYGFRKAAQDDIIKNLRAEKIEIVEPDGTVKLALFNKDNLPPAIYNGKKMSRQGGGESGLMFYNTEGEECGGLIYSGQGENNKGENELSITYDKYKQDQVVQLSYIQRANGNHTKGLTIFERPDFSVDKAMATLDSIRSHVKDPEEQQKVIDNLKAAGYFGYTRMFAGQQGQRTGIFVRDTKGRIRLETIVNENDEPEIIFYNEDGSIHKKISY